MPHQEPKQDKKITLVVVVNGVAAEPPIEVNPNAALASVISKALAATQNSGRPEEDWLLKDSQGKELDRNRKPSDYGLKDGDTIFVTLKAGVGGSR